LSKASKEVRCVECKKMFRTNEVDYVIGLNLTDSAQAKSIFLCENCHSERITQNEKIYRKFFGS